MPSPLSPNLDFLTPLGYAKSESLVKIGAERGRRSLARHGGQDASPKAMLSSSSTSSNAAVVVACSF